MSWLKDLKDVDKDSNYYLQGNSVWWNDIGDGIFVYEIKDAKNRYVELLNAVLSDKEIRKKVDKLIDRRIR